MPNKEKLGAVAEIVDHFNGSSATVITEYRGLTVKQVTQLRQALGGDTTYTVVKNTLTRLAAAEAGVSIDDSLLVGPTAIAFVKGDPVAAAKGLRDFAKTNPLLVIKGGVLEGRSLSAAEVNQIADLDSREVLLAKVAGVLKALPTRAAALFQAPLSQVARLAQALEDKTAAEGGGQASDTSAEAPAALVSDAAEAPAAEAPAEAAATEAPAAAEAPAAPASDAAEAPAAEAPAAEAPAEAATDTPAEPAEQ
ncbi:50S ribosomal protein L10 [Jatrophihabitans sp.]|uniref:50S ribosomal protein L10 n=1 Tax=Jatrophihabitans sp. TaxID=1932789 RepID=UPI0038CDA2FA